MASKIVEEELQNADLYDKVWQAYAAVGDDKAVGVVGDERKYGNIVMIRIVDSIDAMTADWTRLPKRALREDKAIGLQMKLMMLLGYLMLCQASHRLQ